MKRGLFVLFVSFGLSWSITCNAQQRKPATRQVKQQTPEELYNKGVDYFFGKNGCPTDTLKAINMFRKSAEQGYAPAQFDLGLSYERGYGVKQNYSEAAEWYRKAADSGNALAQNFLGAAYEEGKGVPRDYSEAVTWYRKSAEQGYALAQYNLGRCYQDGIGVSDVNLAIEWFQKAAEQNDTDAMRRLYFIYSEGKNIQKDLKKARLWLEKGAESKDKVCEYLKGYNFHFGEDGYPIDIKQAVFWYERSANHGYAMAAGHLGSIYSEGELGDKDVSKAIYWYQMASEGGERMAKCFLADYYKYGDGVELDREKAFSLKRESAVLGFPLSQVELGEMFRDGIGCVKDLEAARYWFQKAIDNKESDPELKNVAKSLLQSTYK